MAKSRNNALRSAAMRVLNASPHRFFVRAWRLPHLRIARLSRAAPRCAALALCCASARNGAHREVSYQRINQRENGEDEKIMAK